MCACKHCSIKLYLYYIEHIGVADEFITSKQTDLTQFFIIKPRHPGGLKKQIWVEKNTVGALVTRGKTPTTATWSEHLKIYAMLLLHNKDQQ